MKNQYNIDVLANMHYGYRKDFACICIKVQHYPILSQTCSHFSVQTTPVQFHWSISKNSPNLYLIYLFSSPCISHILATYK